MKGNVSLYIKDILEGMEKAEKFTDNMTYDEFIRDERTHYAVIRCIEIMGEASKNVPVDIRNKYPKIPWKDIAGMRDKVIHFYFGVNLETVWLVVKRDIPNIKPLLRKVMEELGDG